MMKKYRITGSSLFSGFGGADLGMLQAGLDHAWGIEHDPKIAGVANENGLSVLIGDASNVDYASLAAPGWLHMSPPCLRASSANPLAGESALDLALADACIRAIKTLRSPWISLENVYAYERFESFKRIVATLHDEGYCVRWWHMNAADYGVPQTRKRLILVASRSAEPQRPARTHMKPRSHQHQTSFFAPTPWRSWFDAIHDLIPDLAECDPAPWQLRKLHGTPWQTLLMDSQNTRQEWGSGYRGERETRFTLSTSHHLPRAFIINGTTNENGKSVTVLGDEAPIFCVTTQTGHRQALRAFVGYWVKCSPRCLARFQAFPDRYELPATNGLACKGIGNAVPPLLMQRIVEAQPI